jgi:hypothetical protein
MIMMAAMKITINAEDSKAAQNFLALAARTRKICARDENGSARTAVKITSIAVEPQESAAR